jgi:hypothetical protein
MTQAGGSADPEDGDSTDSGSKRDSSGRPCPECDETLPTGARFGPACSTASAEDGTAVDLSEVDGLVPEDPTELLVEDERGLRRASGRIRALSGLAAAIPLAPLVLFLVGAVVSLSVWTGALVFVTAWICSAAVLSRARVPAEAFGRSLYLMAVGTLLLPVALAVGGVDSWGETLSISFDTLAMVSLVLAGALVALGSFITGQARKRVTVDRRGFESHREE